MTFEADQAVGPRISRRLRRPSLRLPEGPSCLRSRRLASDCSRPNAGRPRHSAACPSQALRRPSSDRRPRRPAPEPVFSSGRPSVSPVPSHASSPPQRPGLQASPDPARPWRRPAPPAASAARRAASGQGLRAPGRRPCSSDSPAPREAPVRPSSPRRRHAGAPAIVRLFDCSDCSIAGIPWRVSSLRRRGPAGP